jgi:hypothetical protein
MGFTCNARCAGTQHAAIATATNTSATKDRTPGSVGLTPNRIPRRTRVTATAPARPIATPIVVSRSPWPRIIRATFRALAPNATRMPISCVRCDDVPTPHPAQSCGDTSWRSRRPAQRPKCESHVVREGVEQAEHDEARGESGSGEWRKGKAVAGEVHVRTSRRAAVGCRGDRRHDTAAGWINQTGGACDSSMTRPSNRCTERSA